MKVLVIGSGGREHALAWKLDQSEEVSRVFLAPGNAGTADRFTNVNIAAMDIDGLLTFSKKEGMDLVVVGPEDPLSLGIVDRFEAEGIKIFGPNQACAQFESSKDFTKQFLTKYQIPSAKSYTRADFDEAMDIVKSFDLPIVLKADGLCQGKGVIICQTLKEAEQVLNDLLIQKSFGQAASKVVIEEFLEGVEQSLLCFVSDNRIIPLETVQDYKKIGEGNTGSNTGGVGAHSPSHLVNDELNQDIQESLKKIEVGFKEAGYVYNGILFIGFMVKDNKAKVLEFNCRFGDPETEVLMPRLESDLFVLIKRCMEGTLQAEDLAWSNQNSVGIVLFSQGYPNSYEMGVRINQLPKHLKEGEILFHNGTGRNLEGELVTAGGRVLTALALAGDMKTARQKAYHLAGKIEGKSLSYRRDIADL